MIFVRKFILNLKIHPMIHKGYPKHVYQFLLVVLLALCVLLNHLCNHGISKTCLSLLVGGIFSFMCCSTICAPIFEDTHLYIVGFLFLFSFLYLQWSIQLVFIWFMWFLDIPSLQKVGTICSSLAFPLLCYHMF